MKSTSVWAVLAGLMTILLIGPAWSAVPAVQAQSLQYWSTPVNVSNSGLSTDPRIIVDSDGVIYVVWVDAIDGYKYAESADGKVWTSPTNATFPFSVKDDSRPDFFANGKGAHLHRLAG